MSQNEPRPTVEPFTVPLPPSSALAAELAASRHIGVGRFGVAVRVTETMEVSDVLLPLTASGLTGPELGHEVAVALERARVKAARSLLARFAADPDVAAAITPTGPVEGGPVEDGITESEPALAYASGDGVATVYRVPGGAVHSVTLLVGEYFCLDELVEPIRQAGSRALSERVPSPGLEASLAGFDQTMARIEERLAALDEQMAAVLAG